MKYLRKFQNHNAYGAFTNTDGFIKPNISLCVQENEVHYNPWTWAEEYLTTVALEDGTISFNIWQSMGSDMITSISYSTDDGETWTTTANQDNKQENLVIDVNVNEGDKVLWKGIATQTGHYYEDYGDYIGSFFSSDCEFDAKGNVMSLLYGDDFKGETTIEEDGAFCALFSDYDGNVECKVVNAKDLSLPATTLASYCYFCMFFGCTTLTTPPSILPATTLADYCYDDMFYNCTSLTAAPELPATTLASYCYSYMFYNCTSLTTAHALPATTLTNYCYRSMFNGCTSLTTAPELPATTLAESCYVDMFQGCTSLVVAPVLPATTLAINCYYRMFDGCTSLTTAPELSATTLANDCYNSMFSGCVNLITAPVLPATTLESNCYNTMFFGCTSLTTAPELPATTLVQYCYTNMFNGCTNLNYIKAMFTTTPSTTYTQNWVSGVAANGTFVKNSAATWTTTGNNGIPTGWTVQTASA